MTAAISVERLSKRYLLGQRPRYQTLREAITGALRAPFRRRPTEEFLALDDVSCEVREGEVVGIIGANGAGKSTLLKILSRITEPSSGRARIRGRVGSLLEVGTGFHPELTGRENIHLNGAIIGLTRAEVARKFDAIVEFAEVERFLDTPVKHYSSGMYTRLAFAVAAQLEPDVLIVDEVLAVGDAAFQKKCMGRIGALARDGRTVLFVSHNMGAVQGLCTRSVWLSRGKLVDDGPPADVVRRYLAAVSEGTVVAEVADERRGIAIERVQLLNAAGEPSQTFRPGEDLTVEVHYRATRPLGRPYFFLGVNSQFGGMFVASNLFDGHTPEIAEGRGVLACRFEMPFLLPQRFTITLGARTDDGMASLIDSHPVAAFDVAGELRELGLAGELVSYFSADSVPLIMPYEWRLPDGRLVPVVPRRHGPGARSP